jgi:ATP-binding cassette subfamily B protein
MIKKLLASVREYTKPSILSPVFMVGEVVMEVTIPLLMTHLIDQGINQGNIPLIWKIGIALIGCTLISLLCGVLGAKYAAIGSSGFAKNLRKDMFYNVQNFSFSNLDKFSTASLITRLTTDIANVQNAYQMIIRIAARAPMMLIFALIMSFTINQKLSLIFLAVVPVLGAALFLIVAGVHPIFVKVFKTYDKLNSVVEENLRGIRVVKSYVREEFEKKKFFEISNQIYKDFSRAEKIIAFNSPAMQTAAYTCMLLLSWLGGKMIVSTTLTEGQLISLLAYAMQILMSLNMLSMVFVMIIISRASAERIVEVLNEKSDLHNPENPVTTVKDGSVRFKNVNFSYSNDPNKLCLSNIDINIQSGDTVGIIGGTGSSKTSLMQLIPRLYDATEGQVTVGGVDVRDYDIESLRQNVAMVLQKNVLFSGTIRENLCWGKEDATDEELVRACKMAQADDFIRSMPDGYNTHVEQGGSNLSGGQKQRLTIARALLKDPKILILDDSTSAVDTKTDSLIRKSFREELPDMTKFIIAQRISSIEGADKIIVMDGGKVAAIGTHQELMQSQPIYQEVYYTQTKGGK